MKISFPENFFWGTSTSAAQTETAFDHQWKGTLTKDGYLFDRTTDHELHRLEDLEWIARFGNVYRCGIDWSKLQRSSFEKLDEKTLDEYKLFFKELRKRGIRLILVLHHFANPNWFEKNGGWLNPKNTGAFIDFGKQCVSHFGQFVWNWNTFNEPNAYANGAYLLKVFPPHRQSLLQTIRVLKNMGKAHSALYDFIKKEHPKIPVSISFNTTYFKAIHPLGVLPAILFEAWYHRLTIHIFKKMDYWGISYYTYMPFAPFPITEIDNPGKLDRMGIPHDKMWAYFPGGLSIILKKLYKIRRIPIIIIENGICTDDSDLRIQSIKDYLKVIHESLQANIEIKGYIHWSTWDNFEWHLGPTYRFGLVRVNLETKERTITPAGVFYEKITKENTLEI